MTTSRAARGPHVLAFLAAAAVGCFTGDGLLGQPCQSDADCNPVASLAGRTVPCQDHVCGAVCGDGVIQAPYEQCEDGNDDASDDCVDCRTAICGDQAVHADVELCDDGNLDDTDACARCKPATCGDTFVWAGRETCDDGNPDRTDGCVDCRIVFCGDHALNPETEACDDADADEDDGCNTDCKAGAERLSHGIGAGHTCAIRDGVLRCWGRNADGELGYGHAFSVGNEPSDLPPLDIPLVPRIQDVVVGPAYTCVILDEPGDNARCWGRVSASFGVPGFYEPDDVVLGDQPGEVPGPAIPLGGAVVQLAFSWSGSCALLAGGAVRCWYPTLDADLEPLLEPLPVDLPEPAQQLAGGSDVCAILDSGDLWCSVPYMPYKVLANRRVAQISGGAQHRCVRFVDGDVHCWGLNSNGQLGYPDVFEVWDPLEPGPVALGEPAVDIAAGDTHTCAVLVGGGVKCWGSNLHGQLGRPIAMIDDPSAFGPVPIGGPARAITVAAEHSCALLHGGEVRCWGSNRDGALGVGHTDVVGDEADDMPPAPSVLYANP